MFSEIIQDSTPLGRLGKAVLASQLDFLLDADENWTMQLLIPLFKRADDDVFSAVWDGILYGRLNIQVAHALGDAFLYAVSCMGTLFPKESRIRGEFVTFYASMVAYFVDEPVDSWIPKFFENAKSEDRGRFAWTVGSDLDAMEDERQQKLWDRWLKRYWKNRLQGIPEQLEASEIEVMLDWLPHFKGLFPEAVELAIQMPHTPLERSSIVDVINEGELWSEYPDATAKLLIHLADSKSPEWVWYCGNALVEKLIGCGLPTDLKTKLKTIRASLGL